MDNKNPRRLLNKFAIVTLACVLAIAAASISISIRGFDFSGGYRSAKVVGTSVSSLLLVGGSDVFVVVGVAPPTVTTQAATGIAMTAAGVTSGLFRGSSDNLGGASIVNVTFQYGLTESYGSETSIQTVNATGNVTQAIPSNLTPGATYHYRIVGVNEGGTTNGSDESFTLIMPTVTTSASTSVGRDTSTQLGYATLNANVSDMGVASDAYLFFEYGLTTIYGTTTISTVVSATGDYAAAVTSLPQSGTYHYRVGIQVGDTVIYGADSTFSFASIVSTFVGLSVVLATMPVLLFLMLIGMTGKKTWEAARGGNATAILKVTVISILIIIVGAILFYNLLTAFYSLMIQ